MEYEKKIGVTTWPCSKGHKVSALALTTVLTVMCLSIQAQKIWEDRTGCAIAQGDLAPGYLFAQKTVTAYVDGDAAIFFENRFAAEGATWISFATAASGPTGVKVNDAMFWGAEYHFLKPSRWDPFISLTPGVGLVSVAYRNEEGVLMRTPYTIAPLGSASIGCNYYVGSIFHFFVKVQGVVGQVTSVMPTSSRLDELKFTGGLAFNLRLWKPKKTAPKVNGW
jgi:hypothetical protein